MKKSKNMRVGELFTLDHIQFNVLQSDSDSFLVAKPPMHTRINVPCQLRGRIWDVKVVKDGWKFVAIGNTNEGKTVHFPVYKQQKVIRIYGRR